MTMLSQERSAAEVTRVWLLGGFRVSVGERKVDESAWRLRKAASLVKVLALSASHRLHRERVMDLLWPDLDPSAAANNLNHVLHHARRTLVPANTPGASHHLLLRGEQLALCPDAPLWVDVETFQEASTFARRAHEPAAYRAAIELCSGELLPEDRYEEWTQSRRQELRQTFLSLLIELAGLYEERGEEEELDLAVQALQRALAEEPTNEEAHVGLPTVTFHCQQGRMIGPWLETFGPYVRHIVARFPTISNLVWRGISDLCSRSTRGAGKWLSSWFCRDRPVPRAAGWGNGPGLCALVRDMFKRPGSSL